MRAGDSLQKTGGWVSWKRAVQCRLWASGGKKMGRHLLLIVWTSVPPRMQELQESAVRVGRSEGHPGATRGLPLWHFSRVPGAEEAHFRVYHNLS